MKIIHINRPLIKQDNVIKELAMIMRTRMGKRAREWAIRKYAAQVKSGIRGLNQKG